MTDRASSRYCATVEYDGSDYLGYQRQLPNQPTIQGELEAALGRIVKQPVPVIGAGRTDSGVHATGQVVAFDLAWRHGCEPLLKAMNANLPSAIAVQKVVEVAPRFHPRFDARRRAYRYIIQDCSQSPRRPLTRLRHWQVHTPLDLDAMIAAAAHLVGEHDFATFGQPPQGSNTVREVFVAHWQRDGDLLHFSIEANAFLYRMVRSIVGTLKAVGDQSWTIDEFVAAFMACERGRAATTAPAHGLYLESVTY